MIPNTSFAVASVQVSQLPIQCSQIEGYYSGAAQAWLQVHDSCIAPAVGAVPLWEMPVNPTSQFQETLQVARLNLTEGLFVGLSSTEGTWTASASTMDITVWTDTIVIATNTVGDKTTLVSAWQIWSEAVGLVIPKRLYQLIISYSGVGPFNAVIYADDTPVNANPGLQIFTASTGQLSTIYRFRFGNGLRPFDQALPSTLRWGCTVQLQSSLQNYTANATGTILAVTN